VHNPTETMLSHPRSQVKYGEINTTGNLARQAIRIKLRILSQTLNRSRSVQSDRCKVKSVSRSPTRQTRTKDPRFEKIAKTSGGMLYSHSGLLLLAHETASSDYLSRGGYVMPGVCLFVCLSVSNFSLKNYRKRLRENFITDVSVDKEELIKL